MSKAEEKSEQYRAFREQCGIKDPVMLNEIEEAYFEGYHQAEKDLSDKAKVSSGWDGFYYGQGYKQAEKDLELTWEDLAIIKQLSDDFVKHNQTPISDEEFYKEIVKRFKEKKGRRA